ncbi:TPA: hypothetical protein N0F65_005240, partial [Lagenidium giganteum]
SPPTPEPTSSGLCKSDVISLQADTGRFVARCHNCAPGATYPDSATVHIDTPVDHPYAQWIIHRMSNGKAALQSVDSNKFLARCSNCHPGGAYPDSAFVHVDFPDNAPWAQWDIEVLTNDKVALRADSGRYLARCNNCVRGGAYADSVFVHSTSSSDPWAQFNVVC